LAEQLYYEDVAVESEIPLLTKRPTTRQLVMWAGASGDYYAIHYDKDFAQSKGLPGVIVHGQLVAAFLGQLITAWIGEKGILKKFSCSYKGMNLPNETIACRGKISKKYIENGENYIECQVWAENDKGEKTVTGKAIIALPARS
jgi:acyl dehydratase